MGKTGKVDRFLYTFLVYVGIFTINAECFIELWNKITEQQNN